MKNSDMPAMPIGLDAAIRFEEGFYDQSALGLTKREQFCLKMGVPKTGDLELDGIIIEGNRIKLAGLAMQGILSDSYNHLGFEDCAEKAVKQADALLAELDKEQGE
jgi:hypothetical protein